MNALYPYLIALAGGFIPALLWLWFWLQEDRKNPEPKIMIFSTFVVGMLCVLIALFFQIKIQYLLGNPPLIILGVIVAPITEELLKFGGAYLVALRSKAMDQPIDALIYMITVALGFAALENVLFLTDTLTTNGLISSLATGNFRFMGATLLHILSSASIGGGIALSFYKSIKKKVLYITIGVLLSILIHAAFNYFLAQNSQIGTLPIFSFVWAGIIILILFFEKVRRIKRKKKLSTN